MFWEVIGAIVSLGLNIVLIYLMIVIADDVDRMAMTMEAIENNLIQT
jgi:hypothetical protein